MGKQLLHVLSVVAMMLLGATIAFSQGTITGKLVDDGNKESLISASVVVKGSTKGVTTDIDGNFTLSGVPAGEQTLILSYIGYDNMEKNVTVADGQTLELGTIELSSGAIGISEIQVLANVAIDRKTPVAVSTISVEQIETKLGNQEFPEILKSTPSIYTSKQGGGYGDASINVRGFTQENVALLINGISVSGMEDNKVYWSNWSGLGDVTRTIQVQRGLGASSMATSSVGGTINIVTKTTDQKKGGSVSQMIGNDGFQKTALTLSTGRTDNGWAFTFSGSRTTGDGYIENTYIDAWSYFASVAKEIGDNQQLLFTVFGAPQRHGQRSFWHPIDEQRDVYGKKWNDDFGYYQGQPFTVRENFYHKPQASLNHIWDVDDKTNIVTSAYGSVGRGGGTGDIGRREFLIQHDTYGHQNFDQIARWNQGLSNDIGLPDYASASFTAVGSGDTTTARIAANETDGMIKRASMNEHQWYGVLSKVNHKLSENLTLSGGIDFRFYTGSHYRKVIDLLGADYWYDDDNVNARGVELILPDGTTEFGNLVRPRNDAASLFGSVPDEEKIDYYNDEDINWYGLFAQLEYTEGPLSAFFSGAFNNTQMRRYDFFNKTPGNEVTDWLSFNGGNVKAGANYNIDDNNNIFVNTGYISRAPYFDALFPTFNNDEANADAKNEKVIAFELGYGYRSPSFAVNVNAYYTDWSDKTETLSDRNATGDLIFASLLGVDATHTGLELDFKYQLDPAFTLTGFAGLGDWEWKNNPTGTVADENQNVLSEATYYIDGLKVGGSAQTTVGAGFDWSLTNDLVLNAQWFYFDNLFSTFSPADRDDVSLQGIQALELPSYSLVDLGLTWKFKVGNNDARLNMNVNNLFDKQYIMEAQDRYREGVATDQLISDTRGWFGFGRTWNAGVKVNF